MTRLGLPMVLISPWRLSVPAASGCRESVTLPDRPVGKQVERYLEVPAQLREAVAASRGG